MFNHFSPECTLPSNETYSGFVSGPNARSTLNIVWSCISIIILSTWSILHLDVPAHVTPTKKREKFCRAVYLLWRKIFWMGLKLFSPEFAATGCARKIFATRSNSAELERLARIDGVPWSLTHTILVDMGGIALRFPASHNYTSASTDTSDLISESAGVSRETSASYPVSGDQVPEFIQKFSRRQELIAKLCGKIPWSLYKPHVQHAITMNESSTISKSILKDVAALSGNIWILDSKQLKIAREKKLITKMPNITEQDINDKSKSDGLVKLIAILQVLWLVIQLIARAIQNLPFTQLEITTVAFAATAIIIYSIDFIKPKDLNVPFYVSVSKEVEYEHFVEIAQAAPFAYVQGKRQADIYSLLIGFFSATSFGGVHLFAWNNQFPTEIEQLLWRISALMTIALPYIYICTHLPFIGKPVKKIRTDTRRGMRIGLFCIAVCYVPCRLFLLAESFRSLYYLPPEAFKSTWAGNFPHLG
ncbi:hypothetical protein M441DRAFT_82417 [Trichoderma asperellum CBS 433.97]|uniref:Uncharacterized protein n=1 Tax=Trichoderma asperellum (strain ATCC 204424 / CBS 433.97 / NBRC 101777) TaxID=1042311 RepID=A0A2T3Z079_TRIA4|nr:hypothetical protein M441DRAFT_82417 [Trichoderma asperellum CBS 433.97]PTB38232.1 hypothetical protein M441DRAFT_82417 [Trichoderma asperellum CBS 433.97]